MNCFKDIGIRTKLLISFGVVIILSISLAIVGIATVRTVNGNYTYILENPQQRLQNLLAVKTDFMTMRYRAANFTMNSGDPEFINNTLLPQYEQARTSLNNTLESYIKNNNGDTRQDDVIIKTNHDDAQKLKNILEQYIQFVDKTLEYALAGDFEASDASLKDAIPITTEINNLLEGMIAPAIENTNQVRTDTTNSTKTSIMWLFILTIVLAVLSTFLAISIASIITKPIHKLVEVTESLAKGKLNVKKMEVGKDEIGILVTNFFIAADIFKSLVGDLDDMAKEHHLGDIDVFIDEAKYVGSYREMITSVNKMVVEHITAKKNAMACVTNMVGGDFAANMEQLPGKKAFINDAIEALRVSLRGINDEVDTMIQHAIEGNLSARIDVSKYKGDWVKLMAGLNEVMATVTSPIHESLSVLQEMAKGNFEVSMKGNYNGDFNLIKTSVNETVFNISEYINEISFVLNELADNNFNQEITREYVGKFSNIKNALNNIIEKLNTVITDIHSAADQVADGAKMISESSMTLAQGAAEQASSIQELNATILSINQNTVQNAQNAKEAEGLSFASKNGALKGDKDMKNLLESINRISNSSNNIVKIIKVIDDIAFQTNLLALNAAVEAARVGQYGKGFAVVAKQVRELAGKSKEAAREITDLIEDSIVKVKEGAKMAAVTAKTFNTIVDDVTNVSGIITTITHTSEEQAVAINQVTDGLLQVDIVVQNNSSNSEETASASQELSSQAELLRSLVSIFKTKKDS